MARYVTYNGVTRFDPGGITKINAKALSPIGLSAQGVIALIGEADSGAPGLTIIDDPALAKATYGSGPLADAIRVAFDPSNDIRVPGGAQRVLAYKVNTTLGAGELDQAANTLFGDEASVTDTAAAGSTTTVVNVTTGGLTASDHIGQWAEWDGGAGGVVQRRRITDNGTTDVTVSPGFDGVPQATDVFLILENQLSVVAKAYGVDGNSVSIEFEDGAGANKYVVTLSDGVLTETSPEILGDATLYLKYVGGANLNGNGSVTSIDAAGLVITTDLTAAGVDDAAGMTLQFADGTQREVATNTTGAAAEYTLIPAHALTLTEQAALGTAGVSVRDVTTATASVTGAAGVATGLSTAVLPTADDLALTFAVGETLTAFVNRINATTNFEASVPDGVNGDVVLMKDLDFGTTSTAVDVRFDSAVDPDDSGHLRSDLYELVAWINDFSELAEASRANTAASQEGSEIPLVTSAKLFLEGGARATSTNASWQTAFDAVGDVRANHVVALISQDLANEGNGSSATFASVAAQLKSHVQLMRGTGQSERGGYIGMSGTRTEVLAQAAALNDTDVQLYAQKFTTSDVNGSLKEMDEWSAAVTAAGMRAGAPEVGEPLTFKQCKTTATSQDSSWAPNDKTDRNAMIQAGVMFAEESPTAGFRWVRDITTHVSDDNIAFMDAHTRDAVRFIAFDLRTSLEDRFTGEKATPATVASMKTFISNKCSLYLADNIIVRSDDPENPTGIATIPGHRRIRVSVTGNTASIKLEIFPVTGIVFQLNEIFLQLPVVV
jgi:hypothetical protein